MIVLHAHAKINLWLHIGAREHGSGYHQIETAFCRLQLADELCFESVSHGLELDVEGADLGPPDDNLVTRAARAFRDTTGIDPAVHIRLRKDIPAGAGLGGGSSDAATTLLALNRIHGWPLDAAGLHRLACGLGADVPFFLSGSTLALGCGRGDRLLALPAPPAAAVCLVCPPTPVPTGDAYRAWDALGRMPPPSTPLDPDALLSWETLATLAVNDFETVASRWIGDLTAIRTALLDAGARFALLTGSGSAVYGIFDRPGMPPTTALAERFPHARVIGTRTFVEPGPGRDSHARTD